MSATEHGIARIEEAQLSRAETAKPLAFAERDTNVEAPTATGPENVSDTKSDGVPKIKVAPETKVATEERSIFPGPQISPPEQAKIKKADPKK